MGATATPAPTEGVYRYSAAHFLVALAVMLAAVPFLEDVEFGLPVEGVIMTVVLCSAVVAIGGRRRTLVTAVVLVAPALVSEWVNQFRPDLVSRDITHATGILFIAFVIMRLLHFILTAPRVTSEVLCAAVAVYLLLALIWAFAYMLVGRLVPGAFAFPGVPDPGGGVAGSTALYFSFITLTTVGYGDIVPASKAARLLATAEATAGMFYSTILLARLVAIYSTDRPAAPEPSRNDRALGRPDHD
jgi:voltage-gated potassium channel Kch